MKAYAKQATLIREEEGLKVYQVDYVDQHERHISVEAVGKDMSAALDTIIRRKRKERLENIPMVVWLMSVVGVLFGTSLAAIQSCYPLMTFLGAGFGLSILYTALSRYFKDV